MERTDENLRVMLICDTTKVMLGVNDKLPESSLVAALVILRTVIRDDLSKGLGVRHRYVLDRHAVQSTGNAYKVTFIVTYVSYGRTESLKDVKVWYRMNAEEIADNG